MTAVQTCQDRRRNRGYTCKSANRFPLRLPRIVPNGAEPDAHEFLAKRLHGLVGLDRRTLGGPVTRLAIDDIQLGAPLGVGTVGEVLAGRLKRSGEPVAVKLLLLSVSEDKLVRARFEREMLILQKLHHPNIIRYYGGGKYQGRLFYAMEAVAGGTVKDLLERFDRLSWREVASIARQVCSALQHAHNHGIIHRDLKPGNLFLDQAGNIKLGDFGIARDTHSADLTHQGLTVGTHAYMSPEQIVGAENISGKADLYSLGCVLFELLTGQKPFQGNNFAVLFEQHLHKVPPQVNDFVTDCPPALSNVIRRLLAKAPEERPFNARAVQGEMLELLAEKQIEGPLASDVAASSVVDPGMAMLAKKVGNSKDRTVSWTALGLLATVVALVICVAAIAANR